MVMGEESHLLIMLISKGIDLGTAFLQGVIGSAIIYYDDHCRFACMCCISHHGS
jgi:hypothetical protein